MQARSSSVTVAYAAQVGSADLVPEAMCAVNFAIAFAFEDKLTRSNDRPCEIIVTMSDMLLFVFSCRDNTQ